ncbi:MAG: hypothetical protein EOP41_02935 [Sphingobacteriaceae bacterium]|nr:MAG: hypothetical protein EOP41_02935 [Sphingobacteriaceae bacterium]
MAVVQLCVRDCSGKPAAQRGLAAESPTGPSRARPDNLFTKQQKAICKLPLLFLPGKFNGFDLLKISGWFYVVGDL